MYYEAKRFLDMGTIVYEADELEEHIEDYCSEWYVCGYGYDEEDVVEMTEKTKAMVNGGELLPDWSKVEYDGKTYYIEYCN